MTALPHHLPICEGSIVSESNETKLRAAPTPVLDVPSDAGDDWENSRRDMPDRMRGRGDFHMKHRRIKDAEMLFGAALEIQSLRQQLAFLKAKA